MEKLNIKRVLSGLLAVILVLGNVPVTAFAADDTGLCTHHEVHTDCGYAEGISACGYVCTECAAEPEPEPTTEPEETTEPAATEETKPVCTGLADCAAENHNDGCEKKAADDQAAEEAAAQKAAEEKAAADKAAADAVAALIAELPTLEEIKAKSLQEQGADYNQVQSAYSAYEALTDDQKALLPPAEEVFKPYFDYFNSLTQEAATSGTYGTLSWTLDDSGTLTVTGSGTLYKTATLGLENHKDSIKKVVIGEGITQIGDEALYGLDNLQEVRIPNSVTRIGESAFQDCTSLKNIYFGTGLTYVEREAFYRDTSIENIYISDLAAWCNVSFQNLDASPMGSFTFPHTNATNLYVNGTKITDLVIPSGVTSIGLYCFGFANVNSITIPDSVTSLSKGAFQWSSASSITFGTGLTSIAEYAFCENNNLESVTISSGVTSIGSNAFYGCEALETVSLPNTLKTIGAQAFQSAAITTLEIPKNVTNINQYAFGYTDNLTTVTFVGDMPTLNANAFYANTRTGTVTGYYPVNNSTWNSIPSISGVTWASYDPCAAGHTPVNGICAICGAVQVVKSVFPDANFRDYITDNVTGASDGWLTETELNTVFSMDVSQKEIENLKGIEYFKKLNKLVCNGNQLTELDVTNNTALTWLQCQTNQLKSLDVSKNTALTMLDCYNNDLTELDVTNNIELNYLDCHGNALTELDVTKNTKLETLWCNECQLRSLDVSQNKDLSILYCGKNELTSLDISQNTELTASYSFGANLNSHTIEVDQNRQFDLNTLSTDGFDIGRAMYWSGGTVSGNILTVTAETVTYTYDIDGDAGTGTVTFTLTVSNYCDHSWTAATCIAPKTCSACGATDGTTLNPANHAAEDGVCGCGAVKVSATNFPDENFRRYITSNITGASDGWLTTDELAAVTSISVSNKSIKDLTGIEHFTDLTSLYCYNNQLAALDVSKNTQLKTLYCNVNALTELDVSKNTALETLDCNSNQLTALDVTQNTALKDLACENNRLSALDVSKNLLLEELCCYSNQLTALDISKNTELTRLNCNNNKLEVLDTSKNTKLEELNCSNNCLTSLDFNSNYKSLSTAAVCTGNVYTITVTDNQFDLTKLPGGFDVSKASSWSGGTVDGNTLTVTKDKVTYQYKVFNGVATSGGGYTDVKRVGFTLNVEGFVCTHENMTAGTCQTPAKCGNCGHEGEVDPDNHTLVDNICSGCGHISGVATVTADGVTKAYKTFEEAVTAANSAESAVIQLQQKITSSGDAKFTSNVTLDLNGYDLYMAGGLYDEQIYVNAGASLRVTSSAAARIYGSKAFKVIETSGSLYIGESVKVENTYSNGAEDNAIEVLASGTAEIYGTTETINNVGTLKVNGAVSKIYNQGGAVTVTGGTVGSESAQYPIQNSYNGTTGISGGTVTGSIGISCDSGKVTISGGTINTKLVIGLDNTTDPGATYYGSIVLTGGTFPNGVTVQASYGSGADTPTLAGILGEGYAYSQNGLQVVLTEGQTSITGSVAVVDTSALPTVTGIAVTQTPTKTSYSLDDPLDLTGGRIAVTYSNGSTAEVDMTADMVTGFDSTSLGTKTLTVSYEGKTATFTVTVTCEHSYDQKKATEDYLKSEATCLAPAQYYLSCVCGEAGTETFEYGELGNHNFEDAVCSVCGLPEGLVYTISGDKVTVTDYTGTATSLVIPDTIEGKPVTGIGGSAFRGCTDLISVSIPGGVAAIGNYAFEDCADLKSIDIPDGVLSISSGVFKGCSSLTSINIPNSVTTIGFGAFSGCSSLTSINIPNSVTTIEGSAFRDCSSLINIAIPDSVTSIIGYTFYGCSSLTSIDISESATSIGEYAFCGCSSLTNIDVLDSVVRIGEGAFYGCSGLTSIEISDSVTNIGSAAFYGCSGLTSIEISDSVTSIGSAAFYECSSLTSINIPDSVNIIGNYMFYGCTDLESVIIPADVFKISVGAFQSCSSLASVKFVGDAPTFGEGVFNAVTATAYYPRTATGWNEDTLQQYGGTITWKMYCLDDVHAFDQSVATEDYLVSEATCTAKAVYNKSCVCGAEGTETFEYGELKVHVYDQEKVDAEYLVSEASCTELAVYNKSCVCGAEGTETFEYGELEAHVYDQEKVDAEYLVSEATCTAKAVYNKSCVCGAEGTKTFEYGELKAHVYDREKVDAEYLVSEASCTELAVYNKSCICGAEGEETFEYGELKAHVYDQSVAEAEYLVSEATCTAKAVYYKNCVCGAEGTETFEYGELKAHDYVAVVTPPTCTEGGYTTHTCSACGDSYVDSHKEPLQHDMGEWTVVTEPAAGADGEERRDCSRCDYFETRVIEYRGIVLKLEGEDLLSQNTVWIDGLPYPVKGEGENRYVELPSEEETIMVTYTYHVGDASDVHTQYPTGMKVYRVTNGAAGFRAEHIPELDDLLQYSGSSIRITGKKGIRMITSLTRANKAALTGNGLAGFKLLEYGTALCWASDLAGGESLVLGKSFTRSNYAYKKGVADPVFATSGNLTQYTNVLVGFTNDQCRDDIAMRPYIILEDAGGEQITLYGGTIYRSIGYIAYQNRNVFRSGTESYKYVWDIIHHVYGDKYDADYKG